MVVDRDVVRVKEEKMGNPGMREREGSQMAVIGLSRVILEGFL